MKFILIADTHTDFDCDSTPIYKKYYKEILSKIDFDVLIHAGDWCTKSYKHFDPALSLIREYISKPILTVLGNHDIWRSYNDLTELDDIKSYIREQFSKYDIHYLSEKSFEYEDIIVTGFDGWYNNIEPFTNDFKYLQKFYNDIPLSRYLNKIANDEVQRLLDIDTNNKKSIVVSHFESYKAWDDHYMGANPNYSKLLADNFDIICYGHTHRYSNSIVKHSRVLNCGANYNDPKFLWFEI